MKLYRKVFTNVTMNTFTEYLTSTVCYPGQCTSGKRCCSTKIATKNLTDNITDIFLFTLTVQEGNASQQNRSPVEGAP